MDFLDKAMKSSNALIQSSRERLGSNPLAGIKSKIDATVQSANPFSSQSPPGGSEQAPAGAASADRPLQQQASTSSASTKLASQDSSSSSANPAVASQQSPPQSAGPTDQASDKNASQFAAIAADAEVVTQKAVAGAKNIGNFLFSMANKAGQTVSQTAKQVKQVVENTSILTDLTKEQQEFVKEHGASMQAGELPWAGLDETRAAEIREQVLSLSQDKRNFVRSPPNDANFEFEPKSCYPIALSLLREDPNLGKLRSELVPKLVTEDTFWRNYFYRVSLLKQMSDRGEDMRTNQGWASSRSSSGEGPDEVTSGGGGGDINRSIDESSSQAFQANSLSTGISSTSTINTAPPPTPIYNRSDSSKTDSITTATPNPVLQQQFLTDDSATATNPLTEQDFNTSESSKLFAEADDLRSKLKELNIGSFDDSGGQDG